MLRIYFCLLALVIFTPCFAQQTTWEQLPGTGSQWGGAIARVGNTIYVGARDIYRSTDLGESWGKLAAPANPYNTRSIAAEGQNILVSNVGGLHKVFLSKDAGASWLPLGTPLPAPVALSAKVLLSGSYAYFMGKSSTGEPKIFRYDIVSPNSLWQEIYSAPAYEMVLEGSVLWVGGTGGIFKSVDQGNSWTPVHNTANPVVSLAIHADTLVAGDDTFQTSRSIDGGQSWQAVNTLPGYEQKLFWINNRWIAYTHEQNTSAYWTVRTSTNAFQQSATLRFKSLAAFPSVEGFDTHYFLMEKRGVAVSHDAGMTWRVSLTGLRPDAGEEQIISCDELLLVKDAGRQVFSTDEGNHWFGVLFPNTDLKVIDMVCKGDSYFMLTDDQGQLTLFQYKNDGQYTPVQLPALPYAPYLCADESYLYAYTSSGLFRSGDNGQTWSNNLTPLFFNNRIIHFQNALYCLEGTSFISLQKSTDHGSSWTELNDAVGGIYSLFAGNNNLYMHIGNDLFRSEDEWQTVLKMNENLVDALGNAYLITKVANSGKEILVQVESDTARLFVTSDNGLTWNSRDVGLPAKPTCIGASDDYFFAGTAFKGMFRLDKSTTAITSPEAMVAFTANPNPSSGVFTIQADGISGKWCQVQVYDSKGQLLSTQNGRQAPFQLDLSAYEAGTYFLRVSSAQHIGCLRLVKQ